MIKKLFLASIMMLSMFSFSSCSDEEDMMANADGSTDTADCTVIFWGSAGNNDGWVVSDLADLMVKREEGKINSKVNLVGCIDPTMKYAKALAAKNLGGTIEFELGTKRNTGADTLAVFKEAAGFANGLRMSIEDTTSVSTIDPEWLELYSKVFSSMKSCKANSAYCIYSSDTLAQFIKKAAELHPAKNYVLLFYGHGVGYIPCVGYDANASVSRSTGFGQDTRSCVSSTDGTNRTLSLNDVTNAITNSGVKIKTVFYQCCQMAALEYFASMQNVTEYVVASAEPTLSGYFPQFITYLSEVGDSDEGMKTACKKAVDFYVTDCLGSSSNTYLSSHGFYDLSKTNDLLKPVSEAATWFASAAKTNPQFMNDVVFGSVLVKSSNIKGLDGPLEYDAAHDIQKYYNNASKGGKLTLDKPEDASDFISRIVVTNMSNIFGACFASMMDKALSDDLAAETAGLNMDELRKIYNSYLNTLKQMAYIRCNGTEADDAAYRYASPSVNLFSLNDIGYHANLLQYVQPENRVDELTNMFIMLLSAGDHEGAYQLFTNVMDLMLLALAEPSYANILAIYQATDFDKATGWSKVMENVNVNPLLLVNPTRYDIINQ